MSKLNIGLAVAVVALAAGWGIDHARRSGQPVCDCNLEMLKERAWLLPQVADPTPVKTDLLNDSPIDFQPRIETQK